MNEEWFENLKNQIEACNNCQDLTAVATAATSKIATMIEGIDTQIAALSTLATAPTNLVTLITWATAIALQYAGPVVNLEVQKALVIVQQTNIASAISSQAAKLKC